MFLKTLLIPLYIHQVIMNLIFLKDGSVENDEASIF